MDNGPKVQLLGGDHRETLSEVKPHLMAEHRKGSCTCSVALLFPFIEDSLNQFMVLLHGLTTPSLERRLLRVLDAHVQRTKNKSSSGHSGASR